jgi:hypothetical protein
MKFFKLMILLLLFIGCRQSKQGQHSQATASDKDTVVIHDTAYINNSDYDWQKGFGLTHNPNKDSIWGKPVSYYLDDNDCNAIAFDFYYGYIRPSDNGTTVELLKLASTDNDKLRPFYRWCLNKTLEVSDGALGELVGVPARQYVEKFPDEFFEYMDREKGNWNYKMWTEAIQYSGFFDYPDYDDNKKIKSELYLRMSTNLKNKSERNLQRVKQFANDCNPREL